MIRSRLVDYRTEINVEAVAKAFAISADELERRMAAGRISRWFERGEGNDDNKDRLIFSSAELGVRVTVDETGNVISTAAENTRQRPQQSRTHPASSRDARGGARDRTKTSALMQRESAGVAHLDALLDEALKGTFPASDPIALNFDDRPSATRTDSEPP